MGRYDVSVIGSLADTPQHWIGPVPDIFRKIEEDAKKGIPWMPLPALPGQPIPGMPGSYPNPPPPPAKEFPIVTVCLVTAAAAALVWALTR